MKSLPIGAYAWVCKLMVGSNGYGEQDKEDKGKPRYWVAIELAAGHLGHYGIPSQVGRHEPEVDQRMTEIPEKGSG